MLGVTRNLKKDYIPAKELKISFRDRLQLYLKLLKLGIEVFVLIVLDLMEKALNIFNPQKDENISNQLALVTGGGNGLGRALCFRLAHVGCNIAIVDIDIKSASKTAQEIKETFKINCEAFQCDISSFPAILKLKDEIENQMGSVDVLVNNAGLLYMSNFLKSDVNDIQKVVDVNLTSQFWMVHTFLPGMIERKRGKIVSICSLTAMNTMPSAVVYSATKFGVKGFMSSLYDELCVNDYDKFIRLTTVYPDFMNTRKDLIDVLEKVKHIALPLTPDEVADKSVKGILKRKRNIYISDYTFIHYAVQNLLPDRARKFAKTKSTNIKSYLTS